MKRGLFAMTLIGVVLVGTMVLRSVLASHCDPSGEVVFVQTSSTPVRSVSAEGPQAGSVAEYANQSSLLSEDRLDFHAQEIGWPMNLTVCSGPGGAEPIASITLRKPTVGHRWFVTLEQKNGAYTLDYSVQWPLDGYTDGHK